jgi:hypothetical protein
LGHEFGQCFLDEVHRPVIEGAAHRGPPRWRGGPGQQLNRLVETDRRPLGGQQGDLFGEQRPGQIDGDRCTAADAMIDEDDQAAWPAHRIGGGGHPLHQLSDLDGHTPPSCPRPGSDGDR